MKVFLVLLSSYLIGSILIGDIVALIKKVDLRGQGSGNVGATNVYRTMGPVFGSIVLVGDALKGVIAVLLGEYLGVINGFQWSILTGILAIVGHNWSAFARFHGGKGMATSLGVVIALAPLSLIIAGPVWVLTFFLFGYVSVASVLVAVSYPIAVHVFYPDEVYKLLFAVVVALFAVYKHRTNLQRLLKGEEHRVLYKNKKGAKTR